MMSLTPIDWNLTPEGIAVFAALNAAVSFAPV
jgi:hypothetical protein